MRKDEIEIGGIYAATNGTGQYERRSDRAVRVEALEVGVEYEGSRFSGFHSHKHTVKKTDGVKVKLCDPMNHRGDYVPYLSQEKKGTEVVIPARNLWKPWREIEQGRIWAKFHKQVRAAEKRRDGRVDKEWGRYLDRLDLPTEFGETGRKNLFDPAEYGKPESEDFAALIRAAIAEEGTESKGTPSALAEFEEAVKVREAQRKLSVKIALDERNRALEAGGFEVPDPDDEEEE